MDHARPRQKSRKFELKIYLGLFLLVIAFVPVLLYAFYSLSDIAAQRKYTVLRDSEELVLAERLGKELNAQHSFVPIYVLSGDPKLLTQIKESETRSKDIIENLISLAASREERFTLADIKQKAEKLTSVVQEGVREKIAGYSISQVHEYLAKNSGPLSLELNQALGRFTDAKSADLAEAKERLTDHTDNLIAGLVLISLLATFFVALISVLMVRIVRAKKKADLEMDRVFLHETHLSNARKEAVETVAHDLKNPIASMRLRMELLRKKISTGAADLPAAEKELERLLRVTDSMQRLIQDFLDHAKIEAGRLLLVRSSCAPAALLQEVADNLAPLAQAKNLELRMLPSGGLPDLQCDADRIRQALENLVGNSLKFTPSPGVITLQVSTNNRHIVFSVSDTGPGIPKEKLQNIFNRYWQENSAGRGGTGLGLAIVSGIAKAHGGNVFAESVMGNGASFHLYIPVQQTDTKEAEFFPPHVSPPEQSDTWVG